MIIDVTPSIMKEYFVRADRDYFSMEGYETLLDMYNELDVYMELDPIRICSEWTEYGDFSSLSFKNLICDAGLEEDYLQSLLDEGMEESDEMACEFVYVYVIEFLSNSTNVITLKNGDILVEAY